MTAVLTVVAAGAGCYLLRVSLVVLLAGRQPSPTAVRLAGHVMPAAFASLAAVAILDASVPSDGGGSSPTPLLAALVTVVVARRASSTTTALVAGLTAAALTTAIL